MNSRKKGAAGERELAGILRDYGFEARRGQQYCGINGDADVVSDMPFHIECKRVEHLNLYDAMAQAVHDTNGKIPSVWHRKNNCEWLVTLRLTDFIDFYKDFMEWRHTHGK